MSMYIISAIEAIVMVYKIAYILAEYFLYMCIISTLEAIYSIVHEPVSWPTDFTI